jgi:predicted amidohydrolase YtcJ
VVVDRDPLTIDPLDLKSVQTLMTVIDGEVVYSRDA